MASDALEGYPARSIINCVLSEIIEIKELIRLFRINLAWMTDKDYSSALAIPVPLIGLCAQLSSPSLIVCVLATGPGCYISVTVIVVLGSVLLHPKYFFVL